LGDLNFLDPKEFHLFRHPDGDARVRMVWRDERCWMEVRIARALPLTDAEHLIGLRDGDDREIGLLRNLHGLDETTRRIIDEELARRYMLPVVLEVADVSDNGRKGFGVVVWEVVTNIGPRTFTVRNFRDNAVPITPTRVIMTDVDGNRYDFRDINSLGARAYEVLAKVV